MAEDFHFDQSAVVPYRKKDGELQVLLITSIRKRKWIIPKGFVEFNLSAFESAKKEAYEEAGIIGANETIELGSFKINKYGGDVLIKVYSMEVVEEHEDYSEKNLRKRKWFPLDEAAKKVETSEIGNMIKKLETKLKAIQSS
ncbi:MAG TPA: NUDIX hydrolase [Ignavibacteriaceae bacterium]|nr:NUDIX hydrolase [Ignavibacteriaceae bacterium]